MFLTTEPSIYGKPYIALRVIFGVGTSSSYRAYREAIGYALAELEGEATQLGADGVIGVHFSMSVDSTTFHAGVMGTAIKFLQP